MKTVVTIVSFFLAFSGTVFATDAIPHCLSGGQELSIDDQSVLNLEKTTANQYTTQAHVKGTISTLYPDHSGHKHFAIQFSSQSASGIEVVYNTVFGNTPALKVGMTVEACGEYITSNAATSRYPASPMGAIIHWVHINPSQSANSHPSGFLVIDGTLVGQDTSHAGGGHHGGNL